jgi:hypothetical protein
LNGAAIFLRNAHPKQIVYLPIAPGWCRVLRPAVTTSVPARVLHTPVVRRLLLRRLVDVVDGAAWDADARQRNASRTDMACAIARAEQREFDQLLKGVRYQTRYPRDPSATPYARLKDATAAAGLAEASLLRVLNGETAVPAALAQFGLRAPPVHRTQGKRQVFTHWRQRDRTARTWLAAVQRGRRITDPAAAATWLIGELAAALPPPPPAVPGVLPRWPPERTTLLCRRWGEGVSVPAIAAELGVSRQAVLGKADRLGLPGRHVRLGGTASLA